MKIKFCGAAQAVTGSCHLLTLDNGYTILMDAGFYQGRKKEFNDFNRTWLFNPAEIDCMVLSHLLKHGFSNITVPKLKEEFTLKDVPVPQGKI